MSTLHTVFKSGIERERFMNRALLLFQYQEHLLVKFFTYTQLEQNTRKKQSIPEYTRMTCNLDFH